MADTVFQPPVPGKSGDDGGPPAPGVPHAAGVDNQNTLVSGQDPDSFLGIPYSYNTGLGGSAAPGGDSVGNPSDPSNQPNQYPSTEPISGVTLDETGAPGSQGAPADVINSPGTAMLVSDPNYTAGRPGAGASGGNGSGTQMVPVSVAIGGPQDSTLVQGQYPPARPLPDGAFYPTSDGVGKGDILVGGWKKGVRPGGPPGFVRT